MLRARREAAGISGAPQLTEEEKTAIVHEESQIRYDLHLLKQWETAVPYMETADLT